MAIRTKLDTKGFDEYIEALIKAGDQVDETAQEALQAGAEVLLAGMQRRVTVLTGHLKSKLSISGPYQDGSDHFVYIGLNKGIDAETAREAVANEYGTSVMAAQPFIRPTVAEDGTRARAAMRKVFKSKMGME